MEKRMYEFTEEKLKSIKALYVFGDIHGDYDRVLRAVNKINIKDNMLLFLGDYADRGPAGVETIDMVHRLITENPEQAIALKGNHEDYQSDGSPIFTPCDLVEEVIRKKGDWTAYYQETFAPFLDKLYISAVIPGEILFVHGGVTIRLESWADLENPTKEKERDILWSDPFENDSRLDDNREYPNFRGLGVIFGKGTTRYICNLFGVKRIIRSHQPRKAVKGIFFEHQKRVFTINSTSVYGTKPFILKITPGPPLKILTLFI